MDLTKILEAVEEKNLSIKDVKIEELVPNVVDDIIIIIPNGECMLNLPSNMSADKVKKWKKGRGGMFYKDVKRNLRGESCGQYVVLEGDGKKTIARLIEEEELETFNLLNIIDGKIKDKAFMIVRNLMQDESLTKSNRYIEQIDNIEDQRIVVINTDISSDAEDSDNQGNVSLFDD